MTDIHRHRTPDELAAAAAAFIQAKAEASVEERGSFSLALAGGTTPKATYQRWAQLLTMGKVDAADVHIFWGDERCVPPDDPMSNFRMAYNTLLSQLAIPEDQVHPMRCEQEPKAAAAAYEEVLRQHFGAEARFDLVLLGLGSDGHTASLFPGTELLAEEERWAAAEFIEAIGAWRASLTPAAINASRCVAFLVEGKGKAEAVHQIIKGDHDPEQWPAQIVEPREGELHWFLDEAAALLL